MTTTWALARVLSIPSGSRQPGAQRGGAPREGGGGAARQRGANPPAPVTPVRATLKRGRGASGFARGPRVGLPVCAWDWGCVPPSRVTPSAKRGGRLGFPRGPRARVTLRTNRGWGGATPGSRSTFARRRGGKPLPVGASPVRVAILCARGRGASIPIPARAPHSRAPLAQTGIEGGAPLPFAHGPSRLGCAPPGPLLRAPISRPSPRFRAKRTKGAARTPPCSRAPSPFAAGPISARLHVVNGERRKRGGGGYAGKWGGASKRRGRGHQREGGAHKAGARGNRGGRACEHRSRTTPVRAPSSHAPFARKGGGAKGTRGNWGVGGNKGGSKREMGGGHSREVAHTRQGHGNEGRGRRRLCASLAAYSVCAEKGWRGRGIKEIKEKKRPLILRYKDCLCASSSAPPLLCVPTGD
ncbi:hypothetical protein BJY52DRAFT_1226033 [Lactarius psammicola]|nr:hypothetical protein BJY52DRAFT_1226033 [Lactarius psammicola]